MGSTLKVFHALSILSLVTPGINAAPAGAKLELKAFKNVENKIYKRQDAGGLLDTCSYCPVIRRLSSYLPEDVQERADELNNQLRDLIASVGPQLPGGIPALDSLLNPQQGGLPTDILGGIPIVGGLASALPTNILGDLPVPTDILGGLVPTALPTDILGGLATGLPTDILGGLASGLPTGILGGLVPTALPTDILGGLVPTDILPTDVLGGLATGLPTDVLGGLVPTALPTDILGGLATGLPTDILGGLAS
ncbi:hypothetical protein N0V95_008042, partial [Ascochyta clinopodiicola]